MKPDPQRKRTDAAPGRHLLYAFMGWGIFLYLSAVLLPPLDSRAKSWSRTLWGIAAPTALLTPYTAFAVWSYLYRSWAKLDTVPNKTAYALWVALESLVLLAFGFGALYLLFYVARGAMFSR
jgi:hypothetical protein